MRLDFSNSHQLNMFLISILIGIGFSIIYDAFRFLRIFHKNGTILIFIEDIVYFSICSIITFCFFILYSKGVIRAYVYVGEIIGFIICRITVSKVIFIIIKKIKKVYDKIYYILKVKLLKIKRCSGVYLEKVKEFIKNTIKLLKKIKKL